MSNTFDLQQEDAVTQGDASSLRETVIVHQGALGDFLLALPVLEGMARLHPAMCMDLCAKPELVALIAGRPYVRHAYPPDTAALAPFFHDDLWQRAAVPPFFQTASQVFYFGQRSSRLLVERLAARLNHPVHWIQSFPEPGHVQPVSEFLVQQIRQVGLDIELLTPQLEVAAAERAAVRQWLTACGWDAHCRPVLLHPGSGGRGKIWPLDRWWGLIEWLRSRCAQPICLSLGPADEYLQPFAQQAQTHLDVQLLDSMELPRLAAFLSQCLFYVGNDSGVSHLAAAVGVPTLAIFGPTDPGIWGPVGEHVQIVQSHWPKTEPLTWFRPLEPPVLEPKLRRVLERLLGGSPSK